MALGLLFYGRLEKEKGFDGIIEMIRWSISTPQAEKMEFFIFGSGSLEKDLLPLTEYSHVHFFGFQPLGKIKSYLGNIDYCLMPSDFLETFGLSALNALSWGIPVVGYKKGGLEPFIEGENNLFSYQGKNTGERLISRASVVTETPPVRKVEKKLDLSYYSKEARYERFLKMRESTAPKGEKRKIILVSDFINKVGGIETYLYEVKGILESHGHEVLLRGGYLPKGKLGKLRIYAGLILAPFNFWDARSFKRFLGEEKPNLIRYHSLLRNLGGGVVNVGSKYAHQSHEKKTLWMTYHDFGYFYPYPKELYSVEQIETPLSPQHFMSAVKDKKIIWKLATFFKYLWLYPLKKQLKKQIDLHLVPSPFMEEIVTESYGISKGKVKALEHSVQE